MTGKKTGVLKIREMWACDPSVILGLRKSEGSAGSKNKI